MKPELQAKFIKYLNSRKSHSGFTLIEVMVVIIIMGILVAIGLPYFLSRTANAKQSEAQQSISSINKAQTAYRSEHREFSDSFDKLALGNLSGANIADTPNYSYEISSDISTSTASAQAKDTSLRGYYGATLQYVNSSNYLGISSVLCEAEDPGTTAPGVGTFGLFTPNCPTDYIELSR
ncbi:type IV pilin-like G/H family protein [Merismopedia glauca]|uniref:Prepilin-type cleavage/methylation domain-containing protein n=1 Tax=Merismopedia glauca CCAP 1448/3 TaxID=1296344 RepID=A0A2T1C3Q5_9CYAN|nr:type IV pilin-like G/H family protein [Merismopedia glauca]PSB02881.1 prepilin-type cleavage/methylation domain-containing protein [Merismopedia glauca CCAP 1448/3]